MKTRLAQIAIASVLSIGIAAGAQAATFGLTGADFSQATAASGKTVDGVTLSFSSVGGALTFNGSGVGVAGGPTANRLGGADEAILFTFKPAVTILESVVFEVGGGEDTVSIFDGADNLLTSFIVPSPNNQNASATMSLIDLGVTGNEFKFTSTAVGNNPGVRLTSLTVAPVPVPAALPLLAFGVGALAFAARKKARG